MMDNRVPIMIKVTEIHSKIIRLQLSSRVGNTISLTEPKYPSVWRQKHL